MSQDVMDIRGEQADFASGDRGGVIFHRFVFQGKGPLAFWEGALSLSKSPPKKSKRSFFKETNSFKNDATSDTRKICEEPGISVIVCDIDVAWSSCINTP